jgi:hypothetical protein
MAQPALPKPPAPIDPIRQQLDELDALLQKMLTLPVAAPEAESPAVEQHSPPPEPEPEPLPPLPPPRTILSPPPLDPEPLPQSADPSRPEPTTSEPPPRPTVRIDPPHRSRKPVWTPPPKPVPAPTSIGLKLLLGINFLFDKAVSPLGPLGRWLRGPWGRAAVGGVGLLFLAAALALVLMDWLGWSRLP